MALANGFGICFVAIQLKEWGKKNYDMASDLYGSLYFTITGFHMLHVVIGLLILMTLLVWIKLGYFDDRRIAPLLSADFTGTLSMWSGCFFTTLYLLPYLS